MVLGPASRGAPAAGRISSVSPKKDDQGDDVTNAVLQLLTTGAGSAGALAMLGTGPAGTIVGAVRQLPSR